MLEPLRHELRKKVIILASTSPRRSELLSKMGIEFEVYPSNFNELDIVCDDVRSLCRSLAESKAMTVYEELRKTKRKLDIIIGADTMIEYNGKMFGKPETPEEADKMLTLLSGKQHNVVSAVCLLCIKNDQNIDKKIVFHEETRVFMDDLSPKTVAAYVASGEPMDKAGGYGIQGLGSSLITKIEGDFYNVMGLPVHKLSKYICQMMESQ